MSTKDSSAKYYQNNKDRLRYYSQIILLECKYILWKILVFLKV